MYIIYKTSVYLRSKFVSKSTFIMIKSTFTLAKLLMNLLWAWSKFFYRCVVEKVRAKNKVKLAKRINLVN